MSRALIAMALCGAVSLTSLPLSDASAQSFRQRLHHVTLSAENLESDVQAEIEFGREVAARILGRYPLMELEQQTRYVNLVGQNLLKHASRPELQFHFAVIDTPDINAYSAPGGYIFITRGSIALMQNEAELAAVLAHEIAHVTQKHIVGELNIHAADDSAEAGLAALFGGMSDPARVAFLQALDKAVALLFKQGLKSEDEYEADMVGMLLASSAGYDPAALYDYLRRVQKNKGEHTMVVGATHPSFGNRLYALKTLMREEQLSTQPAARLAERFSQNIKY